MKDQIKKSAQILGPIGTMGGFIADVLTPLGPVTKWLFIGCSVISIILLILYVLNKKKLAQNYLPSTIILTLVFGVFFLINNNTEKGILGDNSESITNMQNSLFNIQESVDRIEDKVDVIDEKIDLGFEKIEALIKTNNPIENPTTAKDFIVNAYLYQSSGLLKQSQTSFEEYFNLSNDFKVDVLLDYCNVFETNNGFMALKAQLNLLPVNDVTKIVKIKRTSIDDTELYYKLINDNLEVDENLIKWSILTLPPTIANSFASDNKVMFEWIYNSFTYHVDLGYNCDQVHQYFFNNSKAKELINTNTFTKSPGYYFYCDYLKNNTTSNPFVRTDEIQQSQKAKELESLYRSKREEGWFR